MCQQCDVKNKLPDNAASKRDFLKTMSGAGLGLAGLSMSRAFAADEKPLPKPENVLTPDAALERLLAGNQRYASGNSQPFDFMQDRAALVGGQNPYAAIVSCADARVVPELCFDEKRGDLFVARVAGNYISPDILASLEYGALVLKTPLIMVLGHQNCGAVIAAISAVEKHQQYPGHIQTVTTAIAPAVRAARKEQGDKTDNVIRQNVKLNVERLEHAAPIIGKLVAEKKLRIVGGVYNLATGRVDMLA